MIPYNFDALVTGITETSHYFQQQAQKQVNTALTLRNWLIGCYLFEYEQNGQDRATYGENLYKKLAEHLLKSGIKGTSRSNLHLFRQFYLAYPTIVQTLSGQLQLSDFPVQEILKLANKQTISENLSIPQIDPLLLLNRLSFSHIIELLKADLPLQRFFYESQTIKNNWSVRELQRAMNSMLFERTGLSTDKAAVVQKHAQGTDLTAEDVFRNPYMLEFLGLSEKTEYSESDLEQAIINHLQTFLLEMGKGFCFEARQKRITFDNTHYRIDLVFYHRILKCHILVDLKIGSFDHADAGQMNVYLNYYSENEMSEGDNPPIGIILCANKNIQLVKYATAGMAQQLFVSKYLVHLPSEDELQKFIQNENNNF
jgi:predicted nuclease of restriction endonuclease-like (RecB) superfamily